MIHQLHLFYDFHFLNLISASLSHHIFYEQFIINPFYLTNDIFGNLLCLNAILILSISKTLTFSFHFA